MSEKKLKILIIGHARHGKDSAAEVLKQLHKQSYSSSSEAACKLFMFDLLKEKYDYLDQDECFEDRINHRSEWFNQICAFNKTDQAALAKEILKEYNVYVGMRSRAELEASRHLFDAIIWVDASQRHKNEPSTSMELNQRDATHVIDNNGTRTQLVKHVNDWFERFTTTSSRSNNT